MTSRCGVLVGEDQTTREKGATDTEHDVILCWHDHERSVILPGGTIGPSSRGVY